jgi:ABC-type multidrug transport system fused ATPase/permease subunit
VLFSNFRKNRQAYRVGLRRGLWINTIFPVMGIAVGAGNAVLAWSGALGLKAGSLSPGDWFLFMQAVGYFWWPLMGIASFWSQFQDGLSAAERVFALIDREPRVRQSGENLPVGAGQAFGVEFGRCAPTARRKRSGRLLAGNRGSPWPWSAHGAGRERPAWPCVSGIPAGLR